VRNVGLTTLLGSGFFLILAPDSWKGSYMVNGWIVNLLLLFSMNLLLLFSMNPRQQESSQEEEDNQRDDSVAAGT